MKRLITGLILFVNPCVLHAQENTESWYFTKPVVNCTGTGQCSFTNELTCFNNSEIDYNCQLISSLADLSVFNLPRQFTVRWGDTTKIFLKFFSPTIKAPPEGKPVVLKFLINLKDTISVSFLVAQAQYKNLLVSTTMQNITYTKNQDILTIPTHAYNKGNTEEEVTLQIANSIFWRQTGQPITFKLPGFTDTLINLQLKKYPSAEFPEDLLPINIQAADGNKQLVSSIMVYAQLTGNRLNFDPRYDLNYENFIIAQAGGIGSGNRYNEYQVGWNKFGQRDGLILSAQYLQYIVNGFYNVQDAYLGYKYKKWKVRAGALYEYAQMPLIGQGVQLAYGSNTNNTSITYFLNSTPNTFSNTVSPLRKASNLLITTNRILRGHKTLSAFFLRQHNNLQLPDFAITGAKLAFMLHRKDSVETGLYLSVNDGQNVKKTGFAALFKMTGQAGRLRYEFNNYVSSKSFAGIFRNAVLLDETVTSLYNDSQRKLKSLQVFIRYYGNSNGLFGASNPIDQYQGNFKMGATASWAFNKINISASPYISYQNLRNFNNNYTLTELKSAFGVSLQANKNLSANASFDVSLLQKRTISIGKINFDNTLPFRLQANVFYKLGGLQVIMQNKPYYIFDLLLENALNRRVFYLLAGPFITKNIINNRVQLNASYNLQLNGANTKPEHFLNAFVQNNISKQLSVNAMYIYINRAIKDYKEFRLGIRYNLPNKISLAPVRRQVYLYEDANQNSRYDEGESPLNNIIFTANQARILKTNADGKLSLLNYKPNSDKLELINGQGYGFFNDANNTILNKRVNYIGMIKLGQVLGTISIKIQRFSNKKTNTNGIPMILTDDNGKEFATYTDDNGVFQIFLPVGKYKIALGKAVINTLKLQQEPTVEITSGTITKITLETDDLQAPPVEIKKFDGLP